MKVQLVTPLNASEVPEESWLWSTEASSIGLAPGNWPLVLDTTLGNGRPFICLSRLADGGRRYHQSDGVLVLHVYND